MVQDNTSELEITYMGGGQFATLPPVFKDDGTTLYIAWKNQIYGYNCKTGRKVQDFCGLNEEIAGFGNTFQDGEECLVACTHVGNLCTWTVENTIKLNENSLPFKNIKSFKVIMDRTTNQSKAIIVFHNQPEDSENAVPRKETKKRKLHQTIGFADYMKGTLQIIPIKIANKKNKDMEYCFDIGETEDGDIYLVFAQKNYLYYVDLKSSENRIFFIRRHMLAQPKYYTTVLALPNSHTASCLAGDSLGNIILYTDLRAVRPAHTTLHWHTLPVRALALSRAGTRLYSGGGEGVMVRWALGDGNGGKLGFVPRLGGTVTWLGVAGADGGVIAVRVDGMGVFAMGRDRGEEGVWIREMMSTGSNLDLGIVYDNRSKCMILNGMNGNLQFYSPGEGTLLYCIDVVSRNRLTNERDKTMANIQVKYVAVNEIGSWYATVEERIDKDAIYELRLKFWHFDAEAQKFHLNTSIEYPHEKEIYGVEFRPNRKKDTFDQCVTISRDGLFKIWHLIEILGVDGALSLTWRCATTAYYKPAFYAACLSFSQDGSVLALGYGPAITIWLPDTCQLKRSLTYEHVLIGKTKSFDYITALAFGRGRCNYLIVEATKKHLIVWNLLTYTLTLRIEMAIVDLIPDPSSCIIAVLKRDNSVYFFEPDQAKPITEYKIPEKDLIKYCRFVPQEATQGKFQSNNSKMKSHFFYLNSKQELYCLGTKIKTSESTKEPLQIGSSNFSKLLAAKISTTIKSRENQKITHENPNIKHQLKKLLDTPNHTQIPISLVACSFLHSLVLNKQTSSEHAIENSAEFDVNVTSSNSIFERRINGSCNETAGPKPGTLLNLNKIKMKDTAWVKII